MKVKEATDTESILVVDGGDFIGTEAYTLRSGGPLSHIDLGVFGRLGVDGSLAVGAAAIVLIGTDAL